MCLCLSPCGVKWHIMSKKVNLFHENNPKYENDEENVVWLSWEGNGVHGMGYTYSTYIYIYLDGCTRKRWWKTFPSSSIFFSFLFFFYLNMKLCIFSSRIHLRCAIVVCTYHNISLRVFTTCYSFLTSPHLHHIHIYKNTPTYLNIFCLFLCGGCFDIFFYYY